MASGKTVWGIDIGHSAVKAMKCRVHEDGFWLVAEAFDFVEYPKLLTQAEANPEELVRDALKEFISRNELKNDLVAISVPGQAGLTRFFKAPPIESKRIPDIVKYEAKQQIPFPLEDVAWDYQIMPGAPEVEGISMDSEVGIFAMKRDQVYRALAPLQEASVDIDFVQLTPVSLYNYVAHDLLPINPLKEDYDPEEQPDSYAIVSMGTETTDLIVTNGFRFWHRSLAIGGNHFTKKLTAELKLTFAKAEHLKRNAREAEDPKLIFQAMRPVFNDLVTEIQRSIGFFKTLDRKAKITKLVPLGNAMQMPGLTSYLSKNLGYETVEFDGFQKLSGSEVTSAPTFRNNILSFGTCYGLCLQGLQKSCLQTNLLPEEIIIDRLIRDKKPWAIGAVAALLLACSVNYAFHWQAWRSAANKEFDTALGEVTSVESVSGNYKQIDSGQIAEVEKLKSIGTYVVGNAENRRLWPELLKAVSTSLPRDPDLPVGQVSDKPISERPDLYIKNIESEYFTDLSTWFSSEIQKKYNETIDNRKRIDDELEAETAKQESADPAEDGEEVSPDSEAVADADMTEEDGFEDAEDVAAEEETVDAPSGPGWIIQLEGFHYRNPVKGAAKKNVGAQYVRNTLLNNLDRGIVMLPDKNNQLREVEMSELGISHPVIVADVPPQDVMIPNPNYVPPKTGEGFIEDEGDSSLLNPNLTELPEDYEPPEIPVRIYKFTIQFCWRETPLSKRLEQERLEQEAEAAQEDNSSEGEE